ncbi:Wzz/FepE/Etk N-terminal domain-containing protein [Segetibacter aerophilus]|uniref:Chain-length determining protein n=1 Tax=Segetibacter aerophilus TaxID=670293 RepID=A0A512BI25_9BACT|nr:Wzz/FepE/Etk N-terminal domain-containing protein [Segetibacter aerophilus]GEO11622.1 chain-length determining protein [Segetibacter aerophilus]
MSTAVAKEITLTELFTWTKRLGKHLLSKWWLIALVAIIMGILGVLYAWSTKPVYVAEITFATENNNSSQLGMYAGIASQFGLDLGGGGTSGVFEGESLMELLKSRTMVEKTLLSPFNKTSQELMVEVFLESNSRKWRDKPSTKNMKFETYPQKADRNRDSIMKNVFDRITKKNLQIERRDKKTNFITIQMKDVNELFAKRFVEILVENALQFYSDYKSKKARQNLRIIETQTDSVRRLLFGNISEVNTINDLNVNPLRQVARTGAQRKQIDVQVNATLYGELLKNLELSRLALRKETPLIQIIDAPILPLEKIKPGRLLTGLVFSFIGIFIISVILILRFIVREPVGKQPIQVQV